MISPYSQPSPRALRKIHSKRSDDGYPARSYQTLLKDPATVAKNGIVPKIGAGLAFDKITSSTPIQQRTFDLLYMPYWT